MRQILAPTFLGLFYVGFIAITTEWWFPDMGSMMYAAVGAVVPGPWSLVSSWINGAGPPLISAVCKHLIWWFTGQDALKKERCVTHMHVLQESRESGCKSFTPSLKIGILPGMLWDAASSNVMLL